MIPFKPMSPILVDEIPEGVEWGYQLKWDGYRIVAWIEDGHVELYSKNMLSMNSKFPELVLALSSLKGKYLLDGEAVILDPETQRPSFQKLQKRGRMKEEASIARAVVANPVQYIVFDLLQIGIEDLRKLPFRERHDRLQLAGAEWQEPLFLTDLFDNGEQLWHWVKQHKWEGIVIKRLSSAYKKAKEHQDWFKRKTSLELEVEIVGLLMKEGRISSLVMRQDGLYRGRNSSGLNGDIKARLGLLPAAKKRSDYFQELPEGLRGETVLWLDSPFIAEVTGVELTEAGTLRHPRIIGLQLK
ncbi:DNA ligase [Paenibacillus psychroresistens]|uniref:DNA ligase n=1 Tax=Paenibacillus psychroresistens TaxID=1778678 RepID=A0A6B8REB8_9BACL|nr:DNA ligase [Paenibacillus psychroresistens]QGQ94821.1 DNA ligase [Paenibacillus psychroresistens]